MKLKSKSGKGVASFLISKQVPLAGAAFQAHMLWLLALEKLVMVGIVEEALEKPCGVS